MAPTGPGRARPAGGRSVPLLRGALRGPPRRHGPPPRPPRTPFGRLDPQEGTQDSAGGERTGRVGRATSIRPPGSRGRTSAVGGWADSLPERSRAEHPPAVSRPPTVVVVGPVAPTRLRGYLEAPQPPEIADDEDDDGDPTRSRCRKAVRQVLRLDLRSPAGVVGEFQVNAEAHGDGSSGRCLEDPRPAEPRNLVRYNGE